MHQACGEQSSASLREALKAVEKIADWTYFEESKKPIQFSTREK
jgi:hypothetical protein